MIFVIDFLFIIIIIMISWNFIVNLNTAMMMKLPWQEVNLYSRGSFHAHMHVICVIKEKADKWWQNYRDEVVFICEQIDKLVCYCECVMMVDQSAVSHKQTCHVSSKAQSISEAHHRPSELLLWWWHTSKAPCTGSRWLFWWIVIGAISKIKFRHVIDSGYTVWSKDF